MLRRKAKRTAESNDKETTNESKKKKAIIEEDSNVESHLEKLLFGEASSLNIFPQDKDHDHSDESDQVSVILLVRYI